MKKYLAITVIFLIVIFTLAKTAFNSFAQVPTPSSSSNISSDLLLDLNLAQQNPAPEQKAILDSQISQAQTTTDIGETNVISPKDTVPAEIKTEPPEQADNPEQTTSEQVISTPVTEDNTGTETSEPSASPDNEKSSPGPENLIPGTSIQEPDDNAASPVPTQTPLGTPESSPTGTDSNQPSASPSDNQGTSPSQDKNSGNNNASPSDQQPLPAQNNQPTTNNSDQQNNIPLENGNAPSDQNQQIDNSSNGTQDQSSGNVQGASTGPKIPWWQKIINFLFPKNK